MHSCCAEVGARGARAPLRPRAVYIPYELAYGANGKPPKIPPAACLIFVMEIKKINGDKVAKKMVFPEWTTAELELWLPSDQEACDKWKADRVSKWEGADEKLRAKYPTREELDAWVDATCDNSKNKSLWKRTRKKKSDGAAAGAPLPRAVPAPLTAASARALLTKAMATFVAPANKVQCSLLYSPPSRAEPRRSQAQLGGREPDTPRPVPQGRSSATEPDAPRPHPRLASLAHSRACAARARVCTGDIAGADQGVRGRTKGVGGHDENDETDARCAEDALSHHGG